MTVADKKKVEDLRKKLSIELCDNFICRLDPSQRFETKIGAIIAIKNFIKESQIDDSILLSCLVDTLSDPDSKVREMVIRVIKEIVNHEIIELLEIKLNEISNSEIKTQIDNLLKELK